MRLLFNFLHRLFPPKFHLSSYPYPLITYNREMDGVYNNGLITTSDGHIWKYVDDSLKNNSSVKVVINDNGTSVVDDDIVKEVKTNGN